MVFQQRKWKEEPDEDQWATVKFKWRSGSISVWKHIFLPLCHDKWSSNTSTGKKLRWREQTQLCLCSAGPNTCSTFQQSNSFTEARDGFCVPNLNLQPFNYETILPSWWMNWNHTAEWQETARNLVSKPTPLLFVFQYSHALQSTHSASGEETWLHSKTWTSTELEHLGQSFFSYSISWGYSWVQLSGFYSHFSDWNRCSFSLRKIACK